jgi:hypothetical protein
MKNKLEKNYVGPGKRFANKEQFENYIGGVGHGFEESFSIGSAGNGGAEVGGGALWDKDRTLRMLTMLGRVGVRQVRGHRRQRRLDVPRHVPGVSEVRWKRRAAGRVGAGLQATGAAGEEVRGADHGLRRRDGGTDGRAARRGHR